MTKRPGLRIHLFDDGPSVIVWATEAREGSQVEHERVFPYRLPAEKFAAALAKSPRLDSLKSRFVWAAGTQRG